MEVQFLYDVRNRACVSIASADYKTVCNFGNILLKYLKYEKYAGISNGSGSGMTLHFGRTTAESDVCLCVTDIVLALIMAQHNAVAVGKYRHFP